MTTDSTLDRVVEGYTEEEQPLQPYALLTAMFNAGLAAALLASSRSRDVRIGLDDVLLIGTATHKVSRLLTKDRVTSFLRAPFTRFEERSGRGEVEEKPRGGGMRRAVGELLTCPYCLGQWVAAGFMTGAVLAPRPTRFLASVFTATAISDFLQVAYRAAEERA